MTHPLFFALLTLAGVLFGAFIQLLRGHMDDARQTVSTALYVGGAFCFLYALTS